MDDQFAQYKVKAAPPKEDFSQYKVAGGGAPSTDDTGVIGPDQTAPNAGLAAPAGANKNIVPARVVAGPVNAALGMKPELYDQNFNPVSEDNKLVPPSLLQSFYKGTAGNAQQGLENLGVGDYGDLTSDKNTPKGEFHPVKAANNLTKAALTYSSTMLPAAIASAPIRTAVTLGSAGLASKAAEKGTSLLTDDPDTQEFVGNMAGLGVGLGVGKKLFLPPEVPTAGQKKAYNVLNPGEGVESMNGGITTLSDILQEASNRSTKNGIITGKPKVKVPEGPAGVKFISDTAQQAIDTHDAAVHQVADPYQNEMVDLRPASQAALKQITPEMLQAAKTNPGTQRVVDSIRTIAAENDGQMAMKDAFDRKHRYNDLLTNELAKSEAQQDVSPAEKQSLRNAANGLRDAYYQRLSDLSGQDVRPLAQKEGQLIEAKANLVKGGEAAVKSKGNDTGENPRLNQLTKAAQRVDVTRPASVLRFLPDAISAVINPEGKTPVGQYVDRVQRTFKNLPPRNSGPQPTPVPGGALPQTLKGAQPELPFGPSTLFDLQQTPHTPVPPDLTNTPAIPAGDEGLLTPGTGKASGKASIYKSDQPVSVNVTPQQRSTMAKAPYGGFTVDDGTVQDYGRTRRRLVTEEHPEIAAQLPSALMDVTGMTKVAPKALPPASSIQLGPSSLPEAIAQAVSTKAPTLQDVKPVSGGAPTAAEERGIKKPVPRQWMRHTEPEVQLYFNHRFDLLRSELADAQSSGDPSAVADVQRRMSELRDLQQNPQQFKKTVGMVEDVTKPKK